MQERTNLAYRDKLTPDLKLIALDETSLTWPRAAGISAECKLFQERSLLLGFSLKYETQLSAMERLIPNFPGFLYRREAQSIVHLLHGDLQSGLYFHLNRADFPGLERIQAARAVHRHLADILTYTTSDYPDVIQSVVFLDIGSGRFDVIQYWIDYPGDRDYAYRHVGDTLDSVLTGMSESRSIDLTGWSRFIARVVRPVLSDLAVTDWNE